MRDQYGQAHSLQRRQDVNAGLPDSQAQSVHDRLRLANSPLT
jgi:hypothetical protein